MSTTAFDASASFHALATDRRFINADAKHEVIGDGMVLVAVAEASESVAAVAEVGRCVCLAAATHRSASSVISSTDNESTTHSE